MPDVILDDLANRRFQVKKRPKSSNLKTTVPNSCQRVFPPAGPLAPRLYKQTRSGIFVLDLDVYHAADFNSESNTPNCLQAVLF